MFGFLREKFSIATRSLLGVFQHAGLRRHHSGDRIEEAPLENTAGFARETASEANRAGLGPATVTRELTGRDVPIRSREEKLQELAQLNARSGAAPSAQDTYTDVQATRNAPDKTAENAPDKDPELKEDDGGTGSGDVTGFLDQFDPHPLMLEGQDDDQSSEPSSDHGPQLADRDGKKKDTKNNGSRGRIEVGLGNTGR